MINVECSIGDVAVAANEPMINAALAACSQFVVSSAACAAKVAFNHLCAADAVKLVGCLIRSKVKLN